MFKTPKFYRLHSPLNKLDPTNRLKVADWLIQLRACAGSACEGAFSPPVTRSEFRLHFNLAGNGFWDELDGMSEIEFFDYLYTRYLRLYKSQSAAIAAFIICNVEWSKDASLARHIRGTADAPGWGETSDGLAIFTWLKVHGSSDDAASQELLMFEWAVVMCESRLTKQGLARTQIIFKLTQFAEEVIARLMEILDIYERVPEQRSAPVHVFVKVMVTLLAEDVPLLRDWGSRLAVDIQTGNLSLTGSRSDWVGKASIVIRAYLPARDQAFTSIRTDQERAPGALHLQRGGPSNARSATSGYPRAYPTPNRSTTSWSSDSARKAKSRPLFGLCTYCDARGCQNAADPEAGKNTCSVFGGCPCKPGASADETQHVDLCRAFLKASGSKYHTPPYLKGVACRSNIWQHTKDVAQSSCAPSASTSRSRSPASVVTNLPDPVSSARIGSENRLRKVQFADDLEQQDDPEEEAPCHDKATVDKCLGVFNRLAVVNRFDRGVFNRSEDYASGSSGDESPGHLVIMQGGSSLVAPHDYFIVEEYNSWLQRLPPGLGLGGRNSEEFKVWRLAQRRVFNRGDQSSDSAPDHPDGETLTINTSALSECLGTFDNLAVDNLAVVNLYGKGATPVGSALDGSMLCSALDGLGGSTLSSAHDRSTLGSALDGIGSSALGFALDGSSLGSTPVSSALDGSMLCSALDRSTLGSVLDGVGSSALGLALDGSSLGTPGIFSSFVTNITRPACRLATFVPHAARSTVGSFCAGALFVMLCVPWTYHLSRSCFALGCNVRDLHMMRHGTTLGSSLDGPTLGSALNGSRLGTSLDVLSSSRLSSVLDGNSSSTLDGLDRLPLSSALDGLAHEALDSVAPGGLTLSSRCCASSGYTISPAPALRSAATSATFT